MDLTKLLNFAIGVATLIPFAVFVLLSLPIYIYRWIIINVVAPNLRPDLCGALSSFSSMFGCEFVLKDFHGRQSRCALVTSGFFNGTLSFSDLEADIERKWIRSTINSEEGKETLQYPEMRQYITSWMGFLFWKEDEEFLLRDHVKLHKISKLHADPEEFVKGLTEELLNKPFPKNKSPWEVHIVHGYRNDKIFPRKMGAHKEENTEDGEMTIWMLRWHHALADGVSTLSLILESMLGLSLDKEFEMLGDTKKIPSCPMKDKLSSLLQLPFNFFADAGRFAGLAFKSQTPYHVHDYAKEWKQSCGKTPFLPVDDFRTVKNAFKVSFTTVLFSCISAALSKSLKQNDEKFGLEFLPISTVLPLPRPAEERRKLLNRFTGSTLDLPVGPDLSPEERLKQSEKCYDLAKRSSFPHLFVGYCQAAGSHLIPVTNMFGYNRFISVSFSNFPGASERADWHGNMMFGSDVALGGLQGVAGLAFMAFSNKDYIRVSVTAEAGVMDRKEVDEIADGISAELECLLKLASVQQ